MDMTIYVGPVVTIIIAAVSFYGMVSARLARTEQQISDLARDMEKHNKVIERTFGLERDMSTAFKRIDELKARDEKLEEKLDSIGGSK